MVWIVFIGFIGMFIHRYKLFKLLVSYSIAAMGLNLFFVLAGNIHFDINVLLFSSLLWGLEAAETAVVLFLFIVTANCLAIINIKKELHIVLLTVHNIVIITFLIAMTAVDVFIVVIQWARSFEWFQRAWWIFT